MYIKESDCDHLQLTINVIAANLILQEMQIRMQICKFLPSHNSSISWAVKEGPKVTELIYIVQTSLSLEICYW